MGQIVRLQNGQLVHVELVGRHEQLSEPYAELVTNQPPQQLYPAPLMPRPIKLRSAARRERPKTPLVSGSTIAFGVFVLGWVAVGLMHPGFGMAVWGAGVTYLVHRLNRGGL